MVTIGDLVPAGINSGFAYALERIMSGSEEVKYLLMKGRVFGIPVDEDGGTEFFIEKEGILEPEGVKVGSGCPLSLVERGSEVIVSVPLFNVEKGYKPSENLDFGSGGKSNINHLSADPFLEGRQVPWSERTALIRDGEIVRYYDCFERTDDLEIPRGVVKTFPQELSLL